MWGHIIMIFVIYDEQCSDDYGLFNTDANCVTNNIDVSAKNLR